MTSTTQPGATPNFHQFFKGCTSLTSVHFLGNSSPFKPVNMNEMFSGCASLEDAYLYALSTTDLRAYDGNGNPLSGMPVPEYNGKGTENAGMTDFFYGCERMYVSPTADAPEAQRASITIGPWMTKLLNGFWWQRADWSGATETVPSYTIQANVYVYGGPTDIRYLMECPALNSVNQFGTSNNYSGIIHLRDDIAIQNLSKWIERNYIEYATGPKDLRPADSAYGTLEASGNLGYAGEYTRPSDVEFNKNQTVTDGGTSVRWSLRRDPSTNVGTLSIFPADNDCRTSGDTGR